MDRTLRSGPFVGYRVYRVWHKAEGRWYAQLVKSETDRTTLQWARLMMSQRLGRRLGPNETVDHQDNNKTNDRHSNLQIMPRAENSSKGRAREPMTELQCACCGKIFMRATRDVRFRLCRGQQTFRCSKACAGWLGAGGTTGVVAGLISRMKQGSIPLARNP